MNVLCLGYFDKFSRFFIKIEKEINKTKPVKFKFYNIYISGCLYHWIRLKPSSWVSMWSWANVFIYKKKYKTLIKNEKSYKGVCFNNFIKFHSTLKPEISKNFLLLQTVSYIDIFHKVFKKFNPSILLVIGDSRMAFEIAIEIAKQNKSKIYYLEQGPFNTTIIDEKGVNANASIREYKTKNNIKHSSFNLRIKIPNKKYFRSPIYRSFDYFLEFLLNNTVLFPPDLKSFYNISFKSIINKKIKKKSFNPTSLKGEKVFLLILQIPFDVNMIYHSPYYKDHFSIIKDVHKNLPLDCILVVREHPLYKNKYEKELYRFAFENNIFFDFENNINDSFKYSDVIIVNNSTVGIEAITKQKSLVVLGNSFYDSSNICLKYHNKTNLKYTLEKALKFSLDINSMNSFLNKYISNYSVQGNITDYNLICAKQIAKILS